MIPEEQENANFSKPYERKQFLSDRQVRTVVGIHSQQLPKGGQLSYNDYIQQQAELDIKNQLIRSAMRIQQSRQEPIDYFVKILYTYKGLCNLDGKSLQIMKQPQKYIDKLGLSDLEQMKKTGQCFVTAGHFSQGKFEGFWENILNLVEYRIKNKKSGLLFDMKPEYEEKVGNILNKEIQKLIQLRKQVNYLLKNPSFTIDVSFWEEIIRKINAKQSQAKLKAFYKEFRDWYSDLKEVQIEEEEREEQPTSPLLGSAIGINPKLITTDEDEKDLRMKLGQKIFTEQFEKGKEKLQVNLSLPKNHGLLSTQIIHERTDTYDTITKQIIEFKKYERMEEDEEQFNDWVPTETEGRYRDRKPYYINRVRVSCEWNNKYNQNHYNDENPPPKTVQGYKFNIFYPDLYDKQKTPQYELLPTDNPDYCVIKFKAGPPYKDIAFKILRKEWDFSEKSGCETIFTKGILHLYFNFKKPRYRI